MSPILKKLLAVPLKRWTKRKRRRKKVEWQFQKLLQAIGLCPEFGSVSRVGLKMIEYSQSWYKCNTIKHECAAY